MLIEGEAVPSDLQLHLARGLRRVATVAEGAANHEYVLGGSDRWPEVASLVDPDSGRIATEHAWKHFKQHASRGKYRYYRLSPSAPPWTVLGYAYTSNNKRELTFLQGLLQELDTRFEVQNICEADARKRVGLDEHLEAELVPVVHEFLVERNDVAPGMLLHLCRYASSAQGALKTLAGTTATVFAVANDHSPAPVAHAMIAGYLGLRVVYLQHAEVTGIFPPLDFDLSILRNEHSREVYRRIGDSRGAVVVAARESGDGVAPRDLAVARSEVVAQGSLPLVIYPSSVVDEEYLLSLAQALRENPSASWVGVKPHPNAREEVTALPDDGLRWLSEVPEEAHIAICGNSSVAIELLARGNLVFNDFALDEVSPDYYGFVASGLTVELPSRHLRTNFWADVPPYDSAKIEKLAEYLPHVGTSKNLQESVEVRPALLQLLDGGGADPFDLLTARREAGLFRELIARPAEALKAARCGTGVLADEEWVLERLRVAPKRLADAMSAAEPLGVESCDSVVDLWLISERQKRGKLAGSSRQFAAVQRFRDTFQGSAEVRCWVDEIAQHVLDHGVRHFS